MPYAGDRALPTPFGTIYASNLTPDLETGIGTWSEEAFRRAMHEGVDREGTQLYLAFPYDHFTKATDEDIHALYSFLMSIPAIRNVTPANQLSFPFCFRPIIAGWKVLFLSQASLEKDTSRSVEWNRGRYLVEGLGHCGSCHTPRNALGGEKKGRPYAGGAAEGWNAPPLNVSLVTTHHWTVDQLAEYLSTGWHKLHGAAAGPMADVAKNLGQASKEEVHAIATYVASLSPQPDNKTAVITDNVGKSQPADVVAIYTGACAKCHNDRNDVGPSKALSLSLSTAVQQGDPANTVRVILHGIQSYRTGGGPYMPAFDAILTRHANCGHHAVYSCALHQPAAMGGHQKRSYKSKTGGSAMTISLKINGKSQEVDVDPSTPLLYVLRNDVGLRGPRFGCGLGQCGACTVHIDGRPTFSCILPIAAVGDREVTMLEGLLEDGKPNKLQQAFIDEEAAQCGYCISGMVMRAQALLRTKPNPIDNEIRNYMRPNLCRCGTHTAIMRAIKRAAIA